MCLGNLRYRQVSVQLDEPTGSVSVLSNVLLWRSAITCPVVNNLIQPNVFPLRRLFNFCDGFLQILIIKADLIEQLCIRAQQFVPRSIFGGEQPRTSASLRILQRLSSFPVLSNADEAFQGRAKHLHQLSIVTWFADVRHLIPIAGGIRSSREWVGVVIIVRIRQEQQLARSCHECLTVFRLHPAKFLGSTRGRRPRSQTLDQRKVLIRLSTAERLSHCPIASAQTELPKLLPDRFKQVSGNTHLEVVLVASSEQMLVRHRTPLCDSLCDTRGDKKAVPSRFRHSFFVVSST
ncbi:hypothetical protein N825_23240 [Skermanella stibiiresistens SB22]|uniref:Uncharacterized protein n=1 Tax=Skermanella stibiiresistens SB22 TaxID=1385369 RepID=W9GWS4_9PROT|nr:hypothetical protein N825_23240 [Skermanella stibiiresistens SB22]